MLEKINPLTLNSWKKLSSHYESMKNVHMRDLFNSDKERFKKFSLYFEDIFVDYSKILLQKKL